MSYGSESSGSVDPSPRNVAEIEATRLSATPTLTAPRLTLPPASQTHDWQYARDRISQAHRGFHMMTRFLESHESETRQLVNSYQQCVVDFEALQRLMLQFHGHLVDLRDSTKRIADRRITDQQLMRDLELRSISRKHL